jgi:hypothetical protein
MGSVDHPEDWIEVTRVERGVTLVRRFGPLPESFRLGGDPDASDVIVETHPPLPPTALRFQRTRSGGYDITDLCTPPLQTGLLPSEPGRGRPRTDAPVHPLRAGTKWMPGDGLVLRFGEERLVLVLRREVAIEDPGMDAGPEETPPRRRATRRGSSRSRTPTPTEEDDDDAVHAPPRRRAGSGGGLADESRRRADAWARHRVPGFAAAQDALRLLRQGAGLGPWGLGGVIFAALSALVGGFLLAMGW